MTRRSSDYTRCPSCGHRTVLFHFGRNGEDYLACSYRRRDEHTTNGYVSCGWECYRWPDSYDTAHDREQRAAWHQANGTSDSDAAQTDTES